MSTNEMLDTYIHRDKTFVDRLWINPENMLITKTIDDLKVITKLLWINPKNIYIYI
jgi:hypothetical protein